MNNQNVMDWLFSPKNGYMLENVIATTFTLSTSLILELAARTECCRSGSDPQTMTEQQMRIMLAQECDNGKTVLTIFCDDYIIPTLGIPKKYNKILTGRYIPQNVCRIKVKMKDKDNGKDRTAFFHPKLLIAHFKNKEETEDKNEKEMEDYFRFAILSKNLTHDTSMLEICALFESQPTDSSQKSDLTVNGKDISSFLREFLDENNQDVQEAMVGKSLKRSEAKDRIENTLNALDEAQLELKLPTDSQKPVSISLQFVSPNNNSVFKKLKEDAESCNDFYCCSDSISEFFWKKISHKGKGYLISNPRSWERIVGENSIPDYAYCVYTATNDNGGVALSDFENGKDRTSVSVHAKFAEFYGEKHIVWLGSANFTENGFLNNYEADVRMEFNISAVKKPQKGLLDSKPFILLSPKPFFKIDAEKIKEGDVIIKKVDKSDLTEKVKTDNCLKKAINKVKWVWEKKDNKLIIEGRPYIPELEKLKQLLIVTSSSFLLEIKEDEEGNKIFKAEKDYNDYLVPWNGRGHFIGFIKYDERVDIPIRILRSKDGENPEQPQLDSDKTAKMLLNGGINIVSLIPPEPVLEGKPRIYSTDDTFDIRLAKFVAKGGKPCNIKIKELKDKIAPDGDEDEDEAPNMQAIKTQEQADFFKKRLENIEEFLKSI